MSVMDNTKLLNLVSLGPKVTQLHDTVFFFLSLSYAPPSFILPSILSYRFYCKLVFRKITLWSCGANDGPQLKVLLTQFPKFWDYMCAPPCQAKLSVSSLHSPGVSTSICRVLLPSFQSI